MGVAQCGAAWGAHSAVLLRGRQAGALAALIAFPLRRPRSRQTGPSCPAAVHPCPYPIFFK
eukprot:366060-Chlamydomonas_euryale.AAC.6